MSETPDFKHLGKVSNIPGSPAEAELELFPNPSPGRDFTITMHCSEFTCFCPITRQPDFATIDIAYIPDQHCIESKSLKLYLASFRDVGAFHEAVTNQILDRLAKTCAPRWIKVTGHFKSRGGIGITVEAEEDFRTRRLPGLSGEV